MINTGLVYSGKVTLKLKINDKVFQIENHNNGLPALRKSICNYLAGERMTSADIPQYVDLRKKSASSLTDTWSTCLVKLANITGKESDSDSYGEYAKFTAVIDSDSLVESVTASSSDSFRLYLCSGYTSSTPSKDLAFISMSPLDIAKITPGTQAIIEWYMRIYDYVEV